MYCFVQAISADNVSRQIVWWLGVGVSCGLGLLSKYTMIMLPAGLGLLMLIVPPFRHHLRTPWPWLAALLAGAIFSPNLWWNAAHQFISFQHTSEIAHLDRSLFHPEQLLLFILAQIMVLVPWQPICLFDNHGENCAPPRHTKCYPLPPCPCWVSFFCRPFCLRPTQTGLHRLTLEPVYWSLTACRENQPLSMPR